MILDSLSAAEKYYKIHSGFKEAFEFLRGENIHILPDGKYPIAGNLVYATVSHAKGMGEGVSKLEKHQEYIDIHYVIEGVDRIGWKPYEKCKGHEKLPEPSCDAVKFLDEPDEYFDLEPGMFSVFFPDDAHAPLSGTNEITKIVVKVAV